MMTACAMISSHGKRLIHAGKRPFSVLVSEHESVKKGIISSDGDKSSKFLQRVKIGQHSFLADEPASVGGLDQGPNPYELLMASLGACTSMTLRLYAEKKKIPLEGVEVQLEHAKVYLKDCEECVEDEENKAKSTKKIDKIDRFITLHGENLTEKDRSNLLRIANLCPVHKTLESSSVVTTQLKDGCKESEIGTDLIIPGKVQDLVPGFQVTRVLPFRRKRQVGPFVFLDHMGPVDVSEGPSSTIDVGPHPHIGLSTLTYLYEGAIYHHDSTGANQLILPQEVNYMTAGAGAVHSERGKEAWEKIPTNAEGKKLFHGIQLWVALSKERESMEPTFAHVGKEGLPILNKIIHADGNVEARLVAGEYMGEKVHGVEWGWPMFMLDLQFETDNSSAKITIPKGNEALIYPSIGRVEVGKDLTLLDPTEAAVFENFNDSDKVITIKASKAKTRVCIIGGVPLPEQRHIFWNFVSTEKDKIKNAAENWKVLDRNQFPKVVGEDNEDSIPLPS